MFKRFLGSKATENTPQRLLKSIIEQSRSEVLFSKFGVPDTVMGRFDMLSLHTYLFSRRLLKEKDQGLAGALNQEVFDLFVEDVERALREIGIGDTTVPKRKKKMIRSFFGQIEDFDPVLDDGDASDFMDRVKRRFLTDSKDNPKLLGNYIKDTEAWLESQPMEAILAGDLVWNNPKEIK